MIIATWNVNSVKIRVENTLKWLNLRDPDVVCLQELKCIDSDFPRHAFEDAGYMVATHGQKSYNGVAILAKKNLEDVTIRLDGDQSDEQARYIEATVIGETGTVRVGCLYLPNGNPPDTDKYTYKLNWMDRLIAHVEKRLGDETPFVIAGDYNVIPTDADAKDPAAWAQDALALPKTRAHFRALNALGMTDALRACDGRRGLYSFWDYQAGAWQRDNGILIDHLLLSPQAADRLLGAGIDKETRGWERPSDHVPVWCEIAA